MRALTAEESRVAERRAVAEKGLSLASLMDSAGRAVAEEVTSRFPTGRVAVLAGPGNNGGDGWVAALVLHQAGRPVCVAASRDPLQGVPTGIAADAARAAIDAGVEWTIADEAAVRELAQGAGVVIDAMLGTGSSLPLRPPLSGWVEGLLSSRARVIAVDLPTGVDADTGAVPGQAVQAEVTVTFSAVKRGLVMYPGASMAGEVVVRDIGIPSEITDAADAPEVWSPHDYARLLPRPKSDAHKNERGRILVIAGSGRFPGAAVLAARGAMRVGSGYVTLAVPDSVVDIAQGHLLAATVTGLQQGRLRTFVSASVEAAAHLARDYDAVVLGPGLTLSDGAVAFVRALVPRLDVPLVLDADGLNALIDAVELIDSRSAPTILTPHPGELARLLGVATHVVSSDRLSFGARLASERVAVVLKGAGTITSSCGRQVINTSGTPALATAGTGDVLAGMIGGLLGQGLMPMDAGCVGAYLHGKAGEAAARALSPLCVTAEDVPDFVPAAVAELLESR